MPRSRSHQCRAFGACVTAAQRGVQKRASWASRRAIRAPDRLVWGAFTFVAAAQRRAENENEARQGDHPGAKQTMMRMHVELMLCIPPI